MTGARYSVFGRVHRGSIVGFLLIMFSVGLAIEYSSYLDRVKRIWYLSHMRAAKVQASLRIRAVSPEPSLLAQAVSQEEPSDRKPYP